jgi:hypothetical protein
LQSQLLFHHKTGLCRKVDALSHYFCLYIDADVVFAFVVAAAVVIVVAVII